MQRTEPSLLSQVRMISILLVMQVNVQSLFAYKENVVFIKATSPRIRVVLNAETFHFGFKNFHL